MNLKAQKSSFDLPCEPLSFLLIYVNLISPNCLEYLVRIPCQSVAGSKKHKILFFSFCSE